MYPFGLNQERNDNFAGSKGMRPGPTDYNFEKSGIAGGVQMHKLKSRAIGGPGFGASKARALVSEDTMKASNQAVGPASYENMAMSPLSKNMIRYQAG